MTDVAALLARQARWQKSHASLPWPEKVRIAEQLREDLATMRRTRLKAKRPDELRPPR